MNDHDVDAVASRAKQVLNLQVAELSEEYRYQSLPLCVIDAIFSIGIRYETTSAIVKRYCAFTSQARIRPADDLPPVAEQESVSHFCSRPEQGDFDGMARRVYQGRQRTSTQSGILKAEAVYLFADCLRSRRVEYLQDVGAVASDAAFEASVKAIPGQGSGISLQYFWMLAGSKAFIKPDRMVLRFLESAVGRPVSTEVAASLLTQASERLSPEYPHLNPRLLDYEVWKYQRGAARSH